MIIWRVVGNEIGPHGNGAMYFARKSDADRALREHRKTDPDRARLEGVERIQVKGREGLAEALNDAMGYGCS